MSNIVIVPGWKNSEPEHWQSLWEKKHSAIRVQQSNWDQPTRSNWVTGLVATCNSLSKPILVAHSMGVLTTVIAGLEKQVSIAGAFLVAPVDLSLPSTPIELSNFAPVPLSPLPFPAIVVGSENDPYCSFEKAKWFADGWSAKFYNAGRVGHINCAAGFGDWPLGEKLFRDFCKSVLTGDFP